MHQIMYVTDIYWPRTKKGGAESASILLDFTPYFLGLFTSESSR
jgi:hypothetical protein